MDIFDIIEYFTDNKRILMDEIIDNGILPIKCPKCDSLVTQNGATMTLLGGTPDPNHYWRECSCKCGFKSILEHKYSYGKTVVWFTDKNFVLYGIHGCFEKYTYKHKNCGGNIGIRHVDKITGQITSTVVYTFQPRSSSADEFIICETCGLKEKLT